MVATPRGLLETQWQLFHTAFMESFSACWAAWGTGTQVPTKGNRPVSQRKGFMLPEELGGIRVLSFFLLFHSFPLSRPTPL